MRAPPTITGGRARTWRSSLSSASRVSRRVASSSARVRATDAGRRVFLPGGLGVAQSVSLRVPVVRLPSQAIADGCGHPVDPILGASPNLRLVSGRDYRRPMSPAPASPAHPPEPNQPRGVSGQEPRPPRHRAVQSRCKGPDPRHAPSRRSRSSTNASRRLTIVPSPIASGTSVDDILLDRDEHPEILARIGRIEEDRAPLEQVTVLFENHRDRRVEKGMSRADELREREPGNRD